MYADESQTATLSAPPPGDAWVFARAIANYDVQADVGRVTGPSRPLAVHLAESAPDSRSKALG